jgi:pimeloyl-ACP methyl ester carboxylesterase
MSQTIEPRATEHVLAVDGRRVSYSVIGEGQPAFFFHGSPASRLEARLVAVAAAAKGVQLIAPDRPGVGGSDPQSGRRLMDWPPIVEAISRELAIDRFSVIGYSTGALYAYACAHELADRILSVTVVSGTGTPDLMRGWNAGWLTLLASRTMPGVGNALFGSVAARARQDPIGFQIPGIALVDRLALTEPATRQRFMQSFTEAFRRGAQGVVEDQVLITRPWGFAPGSIRVPTVLWHGSADRTVPARVAMAMAKRIPGSILREVEGEGHISLLAHRATEIFAGSIPHQVGAASA